MNLAAGRGSHRHPLRAEHFAEPFFPRPGGPRPAAIQIEGRYAGLGKRMTSEVRLGQNEEAGQTSGTWELMPDAFADDVQVEAVDDLRAEAVEDGHVPELAGATAKSVYQVFDAHRFAAPIPL